MKCESIRIDDYTGKKMMFFMARTASRRNCTNNYWREKYTLNQKTWHQPKKIDFVLRICYLNHIHIWEAIIQPFGYLIPHMNKKTGGTEDRWSVLLSPHTERSMRMQQMTKHRPLAELDLLDDLREQRAKVRACTRPWRLPR